MGPFIPTAGGFGEVLTATGVRINKGLSHYRPEVSYVEASKDSEEFSYIAVSMKNPIEVENLEEIRPFMIMGLQWSQYSNPTSGGKKTGRGFHLAAGFEYVLSSNFVFRNDLYFGNGPKKQLLIGLSLQFEFGDKTNNNN